MRVLVTGGAGFIGSHVVDKLRDRGHEPIIFDRRPSPWHVDAEPSIETILGEITDREALERAMEDCDAVAHLAAVADVSDVLAEPETAELTNARGTVAVLEAARRSGLKRVLYASTIWVYSDCEPREVDEETLIAPPSHLYTSTKLAGELYCKSYQELYGIDYTILRFGIPYGPRAREAAVVPSFVGRALAGEPLTVAGDGSQSRRFVYVEDLADGVALGLEDVARNRIYNLAGDEDTTILQIAERVRDVVGDVEIVRGPGRSGDFGGKIVSSARARDELGWSASTRFAEGVARYVAWRREQHRGDRGRPAGEPVAAGEADLAGAPPRKVLVISADIGEGHDLPARAIARELREESPGIEVAIVNGLAAMGSVLTKVLRDNSAFMFRRLPRLFDLQYALFMYLPPTRWLSSRLLGAFGRRGLVRLIRAYDPDLIVSTYPGVTAILGDLRRRGRLDVPCYSSVTDLAGLRYWAHRGIDLHLVTHPESVEEVERIAGPGSVRWARPPTDPAFLAVRAREAAREALGLSAEGTVVAVSGGGWGVGDLVGAVGAALELGDVTVLCVCGRNDEARARVAERYAGDPRLQVIGFTERMGDVLAAADVLVHSSAGLTVLEAIIRGCPVVSYGFGYGHVRASNRAYERFGLARVVTRRDALPDALRAAIGEHPGPDRRFAARPSNAAYLLSDERRTEPLPTWRVRTVSAATAMTGAFVLGTWALTASMSYSIVSGITNTKAITRVATTRPQVGVMLDASVRQTPTLLRAAGRDGMRVSVALERVPASSGAVIAGRGDEAVPRLSDGGLVNCWKTRRELHTLARGLGSGHHFIYASSGPNLVQSLFAHGAGGRLVGGAVRLDARHDQVPALRAGEVVEIRVSQIGPALQELGRLDDALRRAHLQAVPVGILLRDSGTPV